MYDYIDTIGMLYSQQYLWLGIKKKKKIQSIEALVSVAIRVFRSRNFLVTQQVFEAFLSVNLKLRWHYFVPLKS